LPGRVFAQQGSQSLPLTSFARGGAIQDIAGVRNKSFTVTWSRFSEKLAHDPRPYTFWM
jgi:hypothetical protein